MKKTIKALSALFLAFAMIFCFAACSSEGDGDLWENATYTTDTEIGEGEKTVTLEVKAADKSVTLKVHTDKTTVGDALLEHGIIAGDESEYGLYVKTVNGITADYDVDQYYWAFYVDGEYALTGVDSTEISESSVYSFEYTK